jgi:hypothetical protein
VCRNKQSFEECDYGLFRTSKCFFLQNLLLVTGAFNDATELAGLSISMSSASMASDMDMFAPNTTTKKSLLDSSPDDAEKNNLSLGELHPQEITDRYWGANRPLRR